MKKKEWYYNTWFIALLCSGWVFIIPAIAGIILLILKTINESKETQEINRIYEDNIRLSNLNTELNNNISSLEQTIDALGVKDYNETLEKIKQLESDSEARLSKTTQEINDNNLLIDRLKLEIQELQQKDDKLQKSVATQTRKISKYKELYNSIDYALSNFLSLEIPYDNCLLNKQEIDDAELISPSIILKLHCMDVKSLRKSYKDNEKLIDEVLKQYSSRYTTKANKSIYNLMVIALRAELQNILYALKYEKLDNAIEQIKKMSDKYLKIAADGNQSIAGTLTKFIGEIEYLFINAIKIEYNYYVKREQAKQEQLALKEQMRQEAEERKALEQEKKKILKEEEKYNNEIAKLQEYVSATNDESELSKLQARILELQSQLSDVVLKKEEINNLQNGKAGTVYIISNLGSFGENVFKVGMTRRLEPKDRINELGNASVPFKFDVHSFIFSEDAVALEHKMHEMLNDRRVNKVNLRKEFFNISLDELEKIVEDIEPTAEFNRTMIASEFRQSISSEVNFTSSYQLDDESDDDEE